MTAQSTNTVATLRINLDVANARRSVKRALSAANEANRELAKLEDGLGVARDQLAELGIRLEVTPNV